MAKLITSRGAQWALSAEFTFNFDDTMEDVNGSEVTLGAVGTNIVEAINLPTGAVVVGGDVVTETAVVGPTAFTVAVGDSVDEDRYLAATAKLAAGRTALVPTGYVGNGENILVTIAPTVADATAGKVTVRVEYVIRNRVNETQTH